jgi:hypothetical protein
MCFERPQGSVVAPATYEGSSIADEIDTKLVETGRDFSPRELKWSGVEGWK